MKLKTYRYYFIIIAIIFFIALAFVWNENLKLSRKINDQKITNFFVTAFTAIGTLATIVYTVKQYKLSELINRTNIKPDIYPQPYMFKMEDDSKPLKIKGLNPNLYLSHAMAFKHDELLSIKNMGPGIAKHIKIKWVYDLAEVEDLIKNIYHITPNDPSKNIQYLNPDTATSINLPNAYLSCCGPKLFRSFKHQNFSNKETPNLPVPETEPFLSKYIKWKEQNFPKERPELLLQIRYLDVQDFEYTNVFDTEVNGVHDIVTFKFILIGSVSTGTS